MGLNKEDSSHQRYILDNCHKLLKNIKMIKNWNKFCLRFLDKNKLKKDQFITNITKERIKWTIELYQYKKSGFKYFQLVDSNFKHFKISNKDSEKFIQQWLDEKI